MKLFPFRRIQGNGGRGAARADTPEWAAEQRERMVEEQLRRRGIRDLRVLEAMRQVPRHEFVPPELAEHAYADYPLSIGQGQTISQPYMVAAMTEALALEGTERVLEVGTGSAYQAAVLARLAGRVYTIERDFALFERARQRLERMGLSATVTVLHGDGSLGYPPCAPYDGIIVTAAAPRVPDTYVEQLREGGRLVIPVGSLESQELLQVRKQQGKPVSHVLGYCRFVPLLGEQGWTGNF